MHTGYRVKADEGNAAGHHCKNGIVPCTEINT
jgi:hypothetical protein